MKNFKFMSIAIFALAMIGISSCKTTSKTALNIKEYRATQPQEAHVLTHMKVADLRVDTLRQLETIPYTKAQMKALGNSIELIRRDALAQACQKHGSDVWIGVIYSIQSDNLKNGLKVTLTGFPAYYTKWQNAELSDTLLYKDMILHSR